MVLNKGDRVVVTVEWESIPKGTRGLVVESSTPLSSPTIAFENGKTLKYSTRRLEKI
jgi:hypothetical protein